MKQEGYLIITDISGYTGFLTQSELEHAHDILDSLFKTLLANINPPLLVSKLEGDAIFVFSPKGSFIQGQTLLESIENLYFAFGTALENMRINTTCTCTACRNIPTLDLKFAIHHGEFIRAMVGGHDELSGPDVILVHRLLKNTVIETTKIKAYAFFTQQAVNAMELQDIADNMVKHTENYEHIGDVPGYVHDLKPIFQTMKERRRILVSPDDGWFTIEADVDAPPAMVWDYLNAPGLRYQWMDVHSFHNTGLNRGRVDVGSVQHCAHGDGKSETTFTIVDWRPFQYVTQDMPSMIPGSRIMMTTQLTPVGDDKTHVVLTWGKPYTKGNMQTNVMRVVHTPLRGIFNKMMSDSIDRLVKMIANDESEGKIICDFNPAQIKAVTA
jgi:uncharacterized protein YndB with AHSA1/START domain